MRDELLSYYERELVYLRQSGAEFAEKYPKIASRLLLEPTRCEDPHVERIIEAFAFLAARVHLKIDDEFPEITESLLGILYPHYIRPVPSMSLVEYFVDPEQSGLTSGITVPRGSVLYSKPVDGYPCKFRACYETTMWPLTVREAGYRTPDRLAPPLKYPGAVAALRVLFECPGNVSFCNLQIPKLRLFLNGEQNVVHTLYELMCANVIQIVVRDSNPQSRRKPVYLAPDCLKQVGFDEEDGMLPYPRRSFLGYRLLQEYFTFPEKFFFFDLTGLEALAAAKFDRGIEVLFLFSPFERSDRQELLESGVSDKTVKLGCCPIVNLFDQSAEPILLTETRSEYPVIPDVRRRHSMEIFSVDEVFTSNPRTGEVQNYEPFYSYRHGTFRDKRETFWLATRRAATGGADEGTDIFVSLVDLSGRPKRPEFDALTVHCTCTNGEIPSRLPFGSESGDFETEGLAAIRRIVALRKPTSTVRPPVGKSALWRLISHLSLNYLSLVEGGREALQEILRLYDFSESIYLQKQVAGITQLKSRRQSARVFSENGIAFVRGMRTEIEFDEEQFVGGGVFLFASVLENFLGQYVSMNSFNQLVATTRQRKEALKEWPPRAGRRILV